MNWIQKLSLCCALSAAVVGCGGSQEPEVRATDGVRTSRPVAVKTVAVEANPARRTSVQPATVLPYFQADIRAKVTGYVQELTADIGDFVPAGAILAKIDVPELEAQRPVIEARIARAVAEEKRATSQIALAESGIKSVEARFQQAQADEGQVQASVAAAESQFTRTDDLVRRGSLQARLLDEARLGRDSEMARATSVTSAIAAAEAEVSVALAKLAAAEADFQAAQADTEIARRQLDELQTQLNFAILTAPFAGIITARNIAPGDLVKNQQAGEALLVICQIDKVRIHIPVPEIDAPLIENGDEVTFTFPSFPAEEKLTAAVSRFTGSLEPSTRSMMVEVEIDNVGHKLLPGMFGHATIALSENIATNTLPARAIRFDESGKAYVYVVSPDETIAVTPITTGTDNGHVVEILTGVEVGTRVLDAHLQRFTAGQKVEVLSN